MAARVPIKVMSRRSSANYQKGRPIAAGLERMLHKKMDMVIGNSGAVVRELRAERVSEARLHLIYNGIDVSADRPDRQAARRALGLGPDDLVGVMVANLIHYKGHCDLIQGLINVAKHLPLEWHIMMAGRDEGIGRQLHSLAIEGGIRPHIKFLGECSDTTTLLAAADFGLLTSHEEGFSNAILEGMAAGLPMIVTDVGGNPEAVIDGVTGLVVPSRNPDAIGEAILRLAGDVSFRVRLGQAGRTRAQAEFSMERCVSAHDELYRSLLDKFISAKGVSVDSNRRAASRPSHS